MSVEVTPLGDACNIQCTYCYQNPLRDAGNTKPRGRYDIPAMKAAIEKAGGDGFTLFGGEPLLLPLQDLEELLRWGFAKYGRNNIQTNGTLITPHHIELFKRYASHVGLSIDGPGALNDARVAGSPERTREMTARSIAALDALLDAGVVPSLIITLHRLNAVTPALQQLGDWIVSLDRRGVTHVRLHLLEIDHADVEPIGLTDDEQVTAYMALRALPLHHVKFDVFEDIRHLLLQDSADVTCVWNACDTYTTSAVTGIDGHGNLGNCGRTNKDGVPWLKAATAGFERYIALYHTPQEYGGCQGCRFFFACKGQCPGTAIDGDWRNRSRQCGVFKRLFAHEEARLLIEGQRPVSLDATRRVEIDRALLDAWARGAQGSNSHGDIPHGDHTDAPDPRRNGFQSHEAQDAAHEMVLAALRTHPPQGLVVDLGAGDGSLLMKVSREFNARVLGIEADRSKFHVSWILHGDLADAEDLLSQYGVDTFIVSARRFEEIPGLERYCRGHARQVVRYSYDEPRDVTVLP